MAHNVELLFGPMLIGVFINSILYGVTIVQAFIYFGNSTRHVLLPCITDVGITSSSDPRWIRYFVVYLLVAESLNTIFDIGVMYEPLVHLWGDERAMIYVPVMVVPDAIITVLISTPVQLFLAWRVRAMSESLVIPGFICLFTTTSFLGGLATGIAVSFLNEYSQFHQFEGAPIGWLVSSAVADALIAASLVWSLYQKKTGVPSTDDLVNRIIRLTVQTGMVTATAAILDVSLFIASTTTLFWVFEFSLSKLYTNSILSTLNARGRWRSLAHATADPISFNASTRRRKTRAMSRTLEFGVMTGASDAEIEGEIAGEIPIRFHSLHDVPAPRDASSSLASSGVTVTTVVERFEDPPSCATS